jgi:hypothetical protein
MTARAYDYPSVHILKHEAALGLMGHFDVVGGAQPLAQKDLALC